jgi:hypothetical protein
LSALGLCRCTGLLLQKAKITQVIEKKYWWNLLKNESMIQNKVTDDVPVAADAP